MGSQTHGSAAVSRDCLCFANTLPGAPSEENRQKSEAAIAEFRELLKIQPGNIAAIDAIGSLLFQMGTERRCRSMARQGHEDQTKTNGAAATIDRRARVAPS